MIKIAILGFGNIGSGVAQALELGRSAITKAIGDSVELAYIVDIADLSASPYKDLVTKDFSVVENDPTVSIVVETIGGQRVAYDYTRRALLAGKSVVTSNKELVSEKGCELEAIAREKGVSYLFEASVGGGIPIIRPLKQCLAANSIKEIYGILNGTTNYILTRMFGENVSFDAALAEAQALGYAEPNPTADVDGIDACRKIAILSDLAFGYNISPSAVYTEGIRNVDVSDAYFARESGYVIKLLGRAAAREDGRIYVLAAPHLIENNRPISVVSGVYNAICVVGDLVGETMFYGSGAGKLPTSSAVLGDVIDAAQRMGAHKDIGWKEEKEGFVADINEMPSAFYLRVNAADEKAAADAFPGIEKIGEKDGFAAYITPVLETAEFNAKLKALEADGVKALSVIRKL